MRRNYYKLRQVSLLQSAMDSYYKLRWFFITKCDTVYYKLRQVLRSAMDLLQIATGIVGFHMTSPKFKLKNYRSYRDFTFTVHSELLKTSFHTNFRFKRVLGFVIE